MIFASSVYDENVTYSHSIAITPGLQFIMQAHILLPVCYFPWQFTRP